MSCSALCIPYKHLSNKYNMYQWYNQRLPENLKKSGLSFEKISITSKDKEQNQATVFRITGGLEEFKAPSAVSFFGVSAN